LEYLIRSGLSENIKYSFDSNGRKFFYFILLIQKLIFLYKEMLLDSHKFIYYFFFLDFNIDFLGLNFFKIVDFLFFESYGSNGIGNILSFYYFYNLWCEFFDFIYILLVFKPETYFEFFGQILWLRLCIAFDFLFERAVEFDVMTDINPFSDSIYIVLEGIRSIFSGNLIDNVPIFFLIFLIMKFTMITMMTIFIMFQIMMMILVMILLTDFLILTIWEVLSFLGEVRTLV
jgi:hypothetical protein